MKKAIILFLFHKTVLEKEGRGKRRIDEISLPSPHSRPAVPKERREEE